MLSPKWNFKNNSKADEEDLTSSGIEKLNLDDEKIKELCFAMFISYYANSRMRR